MSGTGHGPGASDLHPGSLQSQKEGMPPHSPHKPAQLLPFRGPESVGKPGAWRLSSALNAHKLKSLFLNMGNGKRHIGERGGMCEASPGAANQTHV